MRLLLLFLLVLNVAFFAWARWVDVPAPPVARVAQQSIAPLQLAGPAAASVASGEGRAALTTPGAAASSAAGASPPAAPAPAPAPSAPAATPGGSAPASGAAGAPGVAGAAARPGGRCRSVGPFEDSNLADAVADRLRTRGFAPRARSVDSSNPNVYWVYIGELTADAQRRAIQTLNAAGIHDAASMTQPEQSDRLSVGVFADQAHAVKRAEQVRALGFKPTLGTRQRTLTLHWVDFDVGATDTEPKASQLVGVAPKPAPGIGPVKVVDCPASDTG